MIARGQYSDAVLSELENQNDQHLEGISAKVKMLKDVRLCASLLPSFLPSPLVPFLQSRRHTFLIYRRSPSPSATRSAPLPPSLTT